MVWDPSVYMAYGDLRTRPAADLLSRVGCDDPGTVVDLGCGPGNSTALLAARYPNARLIGVDSSPEMLARAAKEGPAAEWVESDAGAYEPPQDARLVFSNATFQWLDNHETLFPRLIERLPAGAELAIQMPSNFSAPSHVLLKELAQEDPWAALCANLRPADPVAAPDDYYGWLAPFAERIDIWTTEYLQVLSGDDAVLNWVKGTALTPYMAVLPKNQHSAFLDAYSARLRQAYPMRSDGSTLFAFKRLFMVAVRG